ATPAHQQLPAPISVLLGRRASRGRVTAVEQTAHSILRYQFVLKTVDLPRLLSPDHPPRPPRASVIIVVTRRPGLHGLRHPVLRVVGPGGPCVRRDVAHRIIS